MFKIDPNKSYIGKTICLGKNRYIITEQDNRCERFYCKSLNYKNALSGYCDFNRVKDKEAAEKSPAYVWIEEGLEIRKFEI